MANPFPLELGQITIERPSDPAVATDWIYTPSPRRIELIVSVQFKIVTDVNVANRRVRLSITDGTSEIIKVGSSQDTPASLTETWAFYNAAVNFTISDVVYNALPPNLIIPLGGTLQSNVTTMQAGDQLSTIRIILATWMRT